MKIRVWPNFDGVEVNKLLDANWQVRWSGHPCALDKHRDYRNGPLNGSFDLDPDEIKGISDTASTGLLFAHRLNVAR